VVLVGGADFFGLLLELQPAARTPISVIAQTPVSVLGLMCIVLSDRCQCAPPKRQSYLDQRLFTVVSREEGEYPERQTEAWLVRSNASSPVSPNRSFSTHSRGCAATPSTGAIRGQGRC
jgi:hypothetical protein